MERKYRVKSAPHVGREVGFGVVVTCFQRMQEDMPYESGPNKTQIDNNQDGNMGVMIGNCSLTVDTSRERVIAESPDGCSIMEALAEVTGSDYRFWRTRQNDR